MVVMTSLDPLRDPASALVDAAEDRVLALEHLHQHVRVMVLRLQQRLGVVDPCRRRFRCSAPPGIAWRRTLPQTSLSGSVPVARQWARGRTGMGSLTSKRCGSWGRFTTSPPRLRDAHDLVGRAGRRSRRSLPEACAPGRPAPDTLTASCRGLRAHGRRASTSHDCSALHKTALAPQPASRATVARPAARRDLAARSNQMACPGPRPPAR